MRFPWQGIGMCRKAGGKIKLWFISFIRLIPSSDDYAAPAAGDTATQRGTCCTRQTRRRLHGRPEDLVCVQVWHGGYNWAHVIKFVIGLCGFPGQGGGGERESPGRSTRHSEQSVSPLSVCHMPSFPQLPFRCSIFFPHLPVQSEVPQVDAVGCHRTPSAG